MKLWRLYPRTDKTEKTHWWYDCTFGSVVRAETEEEARTMVSTGDEVIYHYDNSHPDRDAYGKVTDYNPWLDPEATACVELTYEGKPGEIMYDFHAG
jgi:hypothetical protein